MAHGKGHAIVRSCELPGTGLERTDPCPALVIAQGSTLELTQSRIFDHPARGLQVGEQSSATLERATLERCGATSIVIGTESTAFARELTIQGGPVGLHTGESSRVTLVGARFVDVGDDAVLAVGEASVVLDRCSIERCADAGVRTDHARVLAVGCELRDLHFGMFLQEGSTALLSEVHITGTQFSGVVTKARSTFEQCTISGVGEAAIAAFADADVTVRGGSLTGGEEECLVLDGPARVRLTADTELIAGRLGLVKAPEPEHFVRDAATERRERQVFTLTKGPRGDELVGRPPPNPAFRPFLRAGTMTDWALVARALADLFFPDAKLDATALPDSIVVRGAGPAVLEPLAERLEACLTDAVLLGWALQRLGTASSAPTEKPGGWNKAKSAW